MSTPCTCATETRGGVYPCPAHGHERLKAQPAPRDECYQTGEEPKVGDVIAHERQAQAVGAVALSAEEKQTWVVTSVVGDMVTCKCLDAERWKQAHYTRRMRLLRRRDRKAN